MIWLGEFKGARRSVYIMPVLRRILSRPFRSVRRYALNIHAHKAYNPISHILANSTIFISSQVSIDGNGVIAVSINARLKPLKGGDNAKNQHQTREH